MKLRCAASSKVVAPTRATRAVVRPQTALKPQQKAGMAAIAAGVAMVAAAAPVSACCVVVVLHARVTCRTVAGRQRGCAPTNPPTPTHTQQRNRPGLLPLAMQPLRAYRPTTSSAPPLTTHSLSSVNLQAEAANVINTVASAAEGYPFVPPEWAPAVFTPLVGLVLPAIGMATLFVYM